MTPRRQRSTSVAVRVPRGSVSDLLDMPPLWESCSGETLGAGAIPAGPRQRPEKRVVDNSSLCTRGNDRQQNEAKDTAPRETLNENKNRLLQSKQRDIRYSAWAQGARDANSALDRTPTLPTDLTFTTAPDGFQWFALEDTAGFKTSPLHVDCGYWSLAEASLSLLHHEGWRLFQVTLQRRM